MDKATLKMTLQPSTSTSTDEAQQKVPIPIVYKITGTPREKSTITTPVAAASTPASTTRPPLRLDYLFESNFQGMLVEDLSKLALPVGMRFHIVNRFEDLGPYDPSRIRVYLDKSRTKVANIMFG